jgi:hypothetical protein
MVNSSTTVYFNVLPGVATEALCVFDLETPKLQIEKFGFFQEKIDAGGRLAAGASRRLPPATGHPVERRHGDAPAAPSRALIGALSLAIVAVLALVAVAAWPRLFPGSQTAKVTFKTIPKGATIEIEGRNEGTTTDGTLVRELQVGRTYPVVAKLDGYDPKTEVVQPQKGGSQVTFELQARTATVFLDTQPSGATVEIDGKPVGTTPVAVTTLKPASSVQYSIKKTGYRPAGGTLDVPGPGKETRMVFPLSISDELARIKLMSEPLGAQVYQNGQLLAGVQTPAEVLVEAGKVQRFMLALPNHVPATIDPFTPARGAVGVVKTAKLTPGATVRIESTNDGKVSILGAPHCRDQAPPSECVLAQGTYTVELTTGPTKATHQIVVANKPLTDRFELGFVEAAEGKQIMIGGKSYKKVMLEAGPRVVTLADGDGTKNVQVRVKPGASVVVK